MYAVLHVLKDAVPAALCFSNNKSAASFKELVDTYEDESGAGNGYTAYWPDYEKRKILPSIFRASQWVTELDAEMVARMLWSLFKARAADTTQGMRGEFSIGISNGAILFSIGKLPPRIRPTVGDMYRVPRSLSEDGRGSEGRVIEDNGDTLKVIPCWYWGREGFRHDVEIEEVEASRAMKTYDWLKDHYPERKSWAFDPAAIRPLGT